MSTISELDDRVAAVESVRIPTPGPAPLLSLSRAGTIGLALWIGALVALIDVAVRFVSWSVSPGSVPFINLRFLSLLPTGLILIFGLLGIVLAVLRRRQSRPGPPLYVLCFVAMLELVIVLWNVHWLARLILAGGLASIATRVAIRWWAAFHRVMIATGPVLALSVLGLVGGTEAWREVTRRQAVRSLPPPPPGAPNVLLIVLDTVRADHLSLYGYSRQTTPQIDRWVAERRGVVFRRAVSSAPWTLPSHATMFTGRWPHEAEVAARVPLDARFPTIAEHLRGHGYDTAGAVANLYYCGRWSGLARGFIHYDDYPVDLQEILTSPNLARIFFNKISDKINAGLAYVGARVRPLLRHMQELRKDAVAINQQALDWLDHRDQSGRPFFLFLNYYDTHDPYITPPGFERHFGVSPRTTADYLRLRLNEPPQPIPADQLPQYVDGHDDCLSYLDEQLGALHDALERRGLLENTVVIITSDHGELFGERGLLGHSKTLYKPVIHVPLMLMRPGGAGGPGEVRTPISLRDLPATIADLTGTAARSPFPGGSLARFLQDGLSKDPDADEPILSEMGEATGIDGIGPEFWHYERIHAVVRGDAKYIRRYRPPEHEELYDLRTDAGESRNLANEPTARPAIEAFRKILDRFPRGA